MKKTATRLKPGLQVRGKATKPRKDRKTMLRYFGIRVMCPAMWTEQEKNHMIDVLDNEWDLHILPAIEKRLASIKKGLELD